MVPTSLELWFWLWTITFIVNEVGEALGFDTLVDYIRGRGNVAICIKVDEFCI